MNIIASTGYSSTTSNYRARKAVPPPPNSFILLWEETRKQSRNHLYLWTSKPHREIGGLFWYPLYVLKQLLRSYEQRVLQEQDGKKQLCQLFLILALRWCLTCVFNFLSTLSKPVHPHIYELLPQLIDTWDLTDVRTWLGKAYSLHSRLSRVVGEYFKIWTWPARGVLTLH